MASVWINEFHYDNLGTDADEFIEIAGLAGIDLTGWSLFSITATAARSYSAISPSPAGTIADTTGTGFGTQSTSRRRDESERFARRYCAGGQYRRRGRVHQLRRRVYRDQRPSQWHDQCRCWRVATGRCQRHLDRAHRHRRRFDSTSRGRWPPTIRRGSPEHRPDADHPAAARPSRSRRPTPCARKVPAARRLSRSPSPATTHPATATVNWTVTGLGGAGQANAVDFSGATSGTVTFTGAETTQVIAINVVGDATSKANETFSVTLVRSDRRHHQHRHGERNDPGRRCRADGDLHDPGDQPHLAHW